MKTIWRCFGVIALLFLCFGQEALAETYPSHIVTIVVPYAAGGTDEFFAQTTAQWMTKHFGVKFIVEPVPGAGGNIGSARVAHAPADGYTLLAGTSGSNAVNPAVYKNMPYDARRSLILVAPLATTENVLVVRENSPFTSLSSIITYAKAHPGKLTYASSGIGSVLQLCGAKLAYMTHTVMLHVPYKGTAPALVDVIGGRVDMMFANAPSVINLIDAGKLRAIAVSGSSRLPSLPNVPTVSQAGVKGYDLVSWFGIMAPSKTPEAIVEKLNLSIRDMLNDKSVQNEFLRQGGTPFTLDAKDSKKFYLEQLKKWADIARLAHVEIK